MKRKQKTFSEIPAMPAKNELRRWFNLAVERVRNEGASGQQLSDDFWKDFHARLTAEKRKSKK